ncbi:hypothetical protein TNCT_80041, partial [Trichonephila clavata]
MCEYAQCLPDIVNNNPPFTSPGYFVCRTDDFATGSHKCRKMRNFSI